MSRMYVIYCCLNWADSDCSVADLEMCAVDVEIK